MSNNDVREGEGLVRLLSHDLKSPLGPLTLAVSNLAEGWCGPDEAAGIAKIALAQTERLRRLIDAALIASGRTPALLPGRVGLDVVTCDAALAFETSGGRVGYGPLPAVQVYADRAALRDAIAGLLEVAAGDGGSATLHIAVDAGRSSLVVASQDIGRCARAFSAAQVTDSPSAFALAARRIVETFGGAIELVDDGIVAWLPTASEAGAA